VIAEGSVFDSKKWFAVIFFIKILGAEKKKAKAFLVTGRGGL
jgi:hypothetical protein